MQVDVDYDGNEIITVGDGATGDYTTLLSNSKTTATMILGICVITSILCLFYQITRLGAAGSNEVLRRSALKGILFSGLALAIFGSLTLVVGSFWGFLG